MALKNKIGKNTHKGIDWEQKEIVYLVKQPLGFLFATAINERTMATFSRIKSPIGRAYNVDMNDTVNIKKALNRLGYYQVPSHGISPYPDTPLFQGIERFQRDNNLHVDGLMRPGGPTENTINYALQGGGGRRVNKEDLVKQFNAYNSGAYYDDMSNAGLYTPKDGKCRAIGTCDIKF